MKIRAILPVLALSVAAASSLDAQSPLKVQKLADGVWAAQPEKGANFGWFLLGDGVVAVDSGGDVATAREALEQIAETTGGKPVRTLIVTHAHGDHAGGARTFAAAGAAVVCQDSNAGQILDVLTQPSSDADDPMVGRASLRPVVQSISQRSTLRDRSRVARIYFLGAAHTAGDLVVYLVNEKILFGGDLALNGLQPYMESRDMDPAGWEHALMALSKLPVEKLVPGHGEIGPTRGLQTSLAYVSQVHVVAKRIAESGLGDDMLDAQVRAPENAIPEVPNTPAHIANLEASVRALRAKTARQATPKATPIPTPVAK